MRLYNFLDLYVDRTENIVISTNDDDDIEGVFDEEVFSGKWKDLPSDHDIFYLWVSSVSVKNGVLTITVGY